ncbi:MAG: UTP--glucose-1-phosphate uridylyltransferase [Gemmataceae bacterium]
MSTIDLAVVPVAGAGTRLLPSTKSQPKEMLPVGRKPVVQYIVEELVQAGMRRCLFITGQGKASIENHFDVNAELITFLRETGKEELLEELDFERAKVEYAYTRQRRQLGLGHAILTARPFVGMQSFVVALGDSIIGLNAQSTVVKRMLDAFEAKQADAVIAFEEVPREEVRQYGIAAPRGDASNIFPLADIVEKPAVEDAPSNLAVAARYVFRPTIFDLLAETKPGKGGEIQLTDAIRALIHRGGKVLGVRLPAGEQRYDIGNFESYYAAFVEFAAGRPEVRGKLRDHLKAIL